MLEAAIGMLSCYNYMLLPCSSNSKLINYCYNAIYTYVHCVGPCKIISPVFNELASTYKDKCLFAKVDGDQQLELIKQQEIRSYPTFHFYHAGIKVDEFSGANQDQLRSIVSQYAEKQEECPYK